MTNHTKTAQIWQRVQGQMLLEQRSLAELAAQLEADSAYLRQFPQLEKVCSEEAAALRGILFLSTGRTAKLPRASDPGSLRRCWENLLTRRSAYDLRCADPVFGQAFRELSRMADATGMLLLRQIGSGQRKNGR